MKRNYSFIIGLIWYIRSICPKWTRYILNGIMDVLEFLRHFVRKLNIELILYSDEQLHQIQLVQP